VEISTEMPRRHQAYGESTSLAGLAAVPVMSVHDQLFRVHRIVEHVLRARAPCHDRLED
jgi:hypothetical protein